MVKGIHHTRPPAVAGSFYPGNPSDLEREVSTYLNQWPSRGSAPPKALIVPHAGYVYSALTAAAAYSSLKNYRSHFHRVLLLGPAHRVYVQGLAVPTVPHFNTPLGDISLDTETITNMVEHHHQLTYSDTAHTDEHSLEVQLPFLQKLLGDFDLIPLVVGDAIEEEIAELIEPFWQDETTLIVLSTDLSHFHSYEKAVRLDTKTAEFIEAFKGQKLHEHSACGRIPLSGLLKVCRNQSARIQRFDLRNSGDTAGDKSQVVGYGGWGIYQT